MRCNKAKILISESLDGELSRRKQLSLDRHIASCAECAREKAEFAGLRDVMSFWPDEEPSEWMALNFSQKLEQFQQERLAMKPTRPRWIFGITVSGAAAALVMLGFVMHGLINGPEHRVSVNPPAVVNEQPSSANVNPANEQVNSDTVTNQNMTANEDIGAEPVEPVENVNPPVVVVTKPVATDVPKKRPVRVAYADTTTVSDWHKARSENMASRSHERVAPEQVDEIGAAVAVAVEDTRAYKVANNLGEAGFAMNESVERVRGTIQLAVDMIAYGTPEPESRLDYNGGSTL